MVDGTCSIDGCEAPIRCRALCIKHYSRFRRLGATELPPKDEYTCSVDDCASRGVTRRMCQKHYLRWKHHGSTDDPRITRRAQLAEAKCSAPGCGRMPKSLPMGLCTMHYARMRSNRSLDTLPRPALRDRFLAKVQKTETCWIWTAARDGHGYGQIGIGRTVLYAHRVAYELFIGEIPNGIQIDHACRNPLCVNPCHLRLATLKQNQENLRGARRNSKSGVRGVFRHKGRWRAEVRHNGQQHNVGVFDTLAEADAAATAKRIELFTHNDLDRAR